MGATPNFVVVTASNRDYFSMCLGLVLSIRRVTAPAVPDIVVLDVGLDKVNIETFESLQCRVVDPGWDVAVDPTKVEPWYKAMTARAFLPKHAPGYDTYLWIDSDAWVQAWEPMQALLTAAQDGAIAIVEEKFGAPFDFVIHGPNGPNRRRIEPQFIRKAIQDCYRIGWGEDVVRQFGDMPALNCGVFALQGRSPVWEEWARTYQDGLSRGFDRMLEQQALNIVIRSGRVPAKLFGPAHNFLCSHALPDYNPDIRRFVTPDDAHELIGVMHLADLKATRSVGIKLVPSGASVETSLHYLDLIGLKR